MNSIILAFALSASPGLPTGFASGVACPCGNTCPGTACKTGAACQCVAAPVAGVQEFTVTTTHRGQTRSFKASSIELAKVSMLAWMNAVDGMTPVAMPAVAPVADLGRPVQGCITTQTWNARTRQWESVTQCPNAQR